MTSEWATLELGKICSFAGGSAFKHEHQGGRDGEYPFVKVSDMNAEGNEYRIQGAVNWIDEATRRSIGAKAHPKSATVFAKIGIALTFNRRRRLSRPTIIDNNMMAATPNTGVNEGFLYYLLCTIDFNECSAGSALPYLRQSDLERIPCILPPLSEQAQVAEILTLLDERIEQNRLLVRTMDELAQAVFDSQFVNGQGESDFQIGATESLPAGWRWGEVGDLAHVAAGKRQSARVETPSDRASVPLLGGAGQIAWTTEHLFDERIIVTGRVGTLGVVCRWHGRTWPSDNTLVVTPRLPEAYHFVFEHLRRVDLLALNRGSTQPMLTQRDVRGQPIPIPPDGALRAYFDIADPLFMRANAAQAESRTLATLRDALLPKLISGELRVRDAEAAVSEVL